LGRRFGKVNKYNYLEFFIKSPIKNSIREREQHTVLLAEFGFLSCGLKASKRLFNENINLLGGNMINFWG
jgi:hypothetical protein